MTKDDDLQYACEPCGPLCHIEVPEELARLTHDFAEAIYDPSVGQPLADHLLLLSKVQGVTAVVIAVRRTEGQYFGLECTTLLDEPELDQAQDETPVGQVNPLNAAGDIWGRLNDALFEARSRFSTWQTCAGKGARVRAEGEGALAKWHAKNHYRDRSDSFWVAEMGMPLPTDPVILSFLVELIAPDGEPRATAQLYQMTDESMAKYEQQLESNQEDQSELPEGEEEDIHY